jgi:hypothetical protein
MGVGPPVIELYRQLKLGGALDNVSNVMELGSQDFWCPKPNLVRGLFAAFDRGEPGPELLNTTNASQKPAKLLYEGIGIKYHCIDVDGRTGTLVLDLNFDPTPKEHKNAYDMVTNHGTSEHILNQYNVFKMMHELAKPGGVFVHAVPFTVHLEHGFFNYQPNFFEALARYNGYQTLGIWVGPDWQVASFIPWDPILLDYLALSSKTTHLLVVAQRKMHDREFCVPFQEIYEPMVPDEVRARYSMVVDGEILDSRRVKYLTKDRVLSDHYRVEIMGRDNIIASLQGQVDGLRHELATAKYQLDKARYDAPEHIAERDRQIAGMKGEIETLKRLMASGNVGSAQDAANGGGAGLSAAEQRLVEVLNSTSWRITKPLRYFKENPAIKRILGRR